MADVMDTKFSEAIVNLGDGILNLTVKEINNLQDYLSEQGGIPRNPMMGAAMMAMPAADGASEEVAEEEFTEFDIMLSNIADDKKISAIKAVREIDGALGLKEARDLVTDALSDTPVLLKAAVKKDDIASIEAKFAGMGKVTTKGV